MHDSWFCASTESARKALDRRENWKGNSDRAAESSKIVESFIVVAVAAGITFPNRE